MKEWLKRFSENLNFTPTERAVALTLVGAFLVGLGLKLYRSEGPAAGQFDYSTPDSIFAARSAAPAAAVAGTDSTGTDRSADGSDDTAGLRSGSSGTRGSLRQTLPAQMVDLNRATKQELMTLPGVGEVIAERILVYREEHGAFAAVKDLLKVKGIGKKKLERIEPNCFVEN